MMRDDVYHAGELTMMTGTVTVFLLLRIAVDGPDPGKPSHPIRYIKDWLTIGLPTLLLYTLEREQYHPHYDTALLLLSLAVIVVRFKFNPLTFLPPLDSTYTFAASRTYITAFRTFVTLSTVICILAVDFKEIFTDSYHKTRVYGYSLMDTGVGSFVFMAGLVAPEARAEHSDSWTTRKKNLKKSLGGATVLLVIGALRTLILGYLGYDVSVFEYGRDWNFFFTLAAVKAFSSGILTILPFNTRPWLLGGAIVIGYQTLLSRFGLTEALREGLAGNSLHEGGFLNANREGIFSSVGMVGLYFCGLTLGKIIFQKRTTLGEVRSMYGELAVICFVAWNATVLSHIFVEKASRCYANMTYVVWTVSHNLTIILGILAVEMLANALSYRTVDLAASETSRLYVVGGCKTCVERSRTVSCACLIPAIQQNELLYFLLGNILTGLVNFIYEPHNHGFRPEHALAILAVYLATINGAVTIIFVRKIRLKFW